MKFIISLASLFLILSNDSLAQNTNTNSVLDRFLRQKIEAFGIKPISPLLKNPNSAQFELGKRLFMETELSGNRNISCMTCHHPGTGTSDRLSLSRTADGKGILRRNSPSLFNLGLQPFMFWDGRVHFDSLNKVFTTPERNLPVEVTAVMTSALSAQALFPMVSEDEMKGKEGENEIADSKDNIEAWDRIVLRLKNLDGGNSRNTKYSQLFKQAYPNTPIEKINIGHVAEAIGAFEKEQFQSIGSPFFHYLNGETEALTEKQKRGFAIFVGTGRCIVCHKGGELGNNDFFTSVAVPQWGAAPVTSDKGRGEITGEIFNNYFFKTPSLLNVGLTAPYMHNGAFETLREVINHFNNIRPSLTGYEIPESRKKTMPVVVSVEKNPAKIKEVWDSIQAPFLRHALMLSESDKDDLEAFLSEALADPIWKMQ